MRRISLLAGHAMAAAVAAATPSVDAPGFKLTRPEPRLPNMKVIRRMRQPRWSNEGVRANKQYRLKGVRP